MIKKIKKKMLKQILKVIDIAFLGYFYLVRMLAHVLPPRLLYATYTGLSFLLYHIIPGTSKRYCRNIAAALPEIEDPERIKYIARKSYDELYKGMVDIVVFAKYGERIVRELDVEGSDILDRAYARSKNGGGIIICGHLGGWSIAMAAMAGRGYPSTPLMMNPNKTPTPRFVKAVIDFGISIKAADGYILTGDNAINETRELLKQPKKVLVITVDGIGSTILELFNRPAGMASGAGHFAIDSGVPVLPGFILRKKGGPLNFKVILRDPIDFHPTGDRERDVHAIQQAALTAIEKQIRLTPEQWTQWGALGGWWHKAEELQRRGKEPSGGNNKL